MNNYKRFGLHLSIPSFLIAAFIYAFIYKQLIVFDHDAFKGLYHSSSFIDFLYFSIVTITTTGIGDIHPLSHTARLITVSEAIVGLIIIIGTIIYVAAKNLRNNNL
jgi:voltage-gated potassium channel